MSALKKYWTAVWLMSLCLWPSLSLADNVTNLYFFHSEGCPHCQAENTYLLELENKRTDVQIHKFEVSRSRENAELFSQVSEVLKEPFTGVPVTIIGDHTLIGFSKTTTSLEIESLLDFCQANVCDDSVGSLINPSDPVVSETVVIDEDVVDKNEATGSVSTGEPSVSEDFATAPDGSKTNKDTGKEFVNVPLLGEINTKTFSLPLLAIVLGTIDGFNPCALWALLFLISLLLGMENRKRMWILGTAFIIASALVYFGFMVAWLNVILFIGFITIIRLSVGAVALVGGFFNVRKGLEKKSGCSVTDSDTKRKIINKTKEFLHEKSLWFSLLGIVALAVVVNLIEILCSAGLPVIFTQVLALNDLSTLQYYSYILLYILFFMLDDLFVFFAAMITLRLTGVTTKYTKITQIVGGVLMLIIGILLIFKPAWLMF